MEKYSKYLKIKILNIILLLPAYPGYGANRKLLNEGKGLFGGCSCHMVNDLPDDGAMVIQSVVPLNETNDLLDWEARMWHHQKYNICQAVQFFSEDRVRLIKEKVVIKNAKYGSLPTNPSIELDFSQVDKNSILNDQLFKIIIDNILDGIFFLQMSNLRGCT